MRVKPWLCISICPRRSSPYSFSFSHYVGICDSFSFITTHVQLTSSMNISFFLQHRKAHMTPIEASQQHCPEHTAISHACPPIIVSVALPECTEFWLAQESTCPPHEKLASVAQHCTVIHADDCVKTASSGANGVSLLPHPCMYYGLVRSFFGAPLPVFGATPAPNKLPFFSPPSGGGRVREERRRACGASCRR